MQDDARSKPKTRVQRGKFLAIGCLLFLAMFGKFFRWQLQHNLRFRLRDWRIQFTEQIKEDLFRQRLSANSLRSLPLHHTAVVEGRDNVDVLADWPTATGSALIVTRHTRSPIEHRPQAVAAMRAFVVGNPLVSEQFVA